LYFRNEPISIWDEQDYNTLATNLVQYGEYTFTPGETASSMRPPLYPALVAGVYTLFGIENFAAVRLLQAILGLATVLVVYWLGRCVVAPRTATWLAAMYCFYPSLLIYNDLLLTETLFTLLLTTSILQIVMAIQRNSLGALMLGSVILGLAALTRSVVWLAPPFLAILIALVWTGNWQGRVAAMVTVIGAFAVTIAPWAIRNSRLQETFVTIDVMGGRNFMMGNYQYTPLYRSWDAIAIEGDRSWAHQVFVNYPPEQRRTQGQVDKLALREGIAFARQNPGLTLLRSTVKFFDFWGLERELVAGAGRGYFGQMSKAGLLGLTAIIAGSYAAMMALAIFGLFFAGPIDRRAHWLFIGVIVFICGIHTIAFGHSRYHLPIIPLVLIYAASALTQSSMIWQQRYSRKFALALVCCGILVAGWIWGIIAVDWARFSAAWGDLA
jgi:4-amino-4-deoxy-L-arabinose transferase-like glycosyltransferase